MREAVESVGMTIRPPPIAVLCLLGLGDVEI